MKDNYYTKIIKNRWLIFAMFVLIGILGYYYWTQLFIEAYPDIGENWNFCKND